MSIDRCACGTVVDTDDGECYGEDGKLPATCSACLDVLGQGCHDCGASGDEAHQPECPEYVARSA